MLDKFFRSEKKTAALFLGPSLILYTAYVIFPIFFTFYISLTEWDGVTSETLFTPCTGEIPEGAGFISSFFHGCFFNYTELFQEEQFWISLKNNFIWIIFFGLSPAISLAFAFLFHVKGRTASFFKSIYFLPMVFSLVVVGTIWNWFLKPYGGLFETLAHTLGFLDKDTELSLITDETWGTYALILSASWQHVSYCLILYLAGLSNLKKNVLEAARIDGAKGFKLFWNIILPMLRPANITVFVVTFIGALRMFDIIKIMAPEQEHTMVLSLYMYEK